MAVLVRDTFTASDGPLELHVPDIPGVGAYANGLPSAVSILSNRLHLSADSVAAEAHLDWTAPFGTGLFRGFFNNTPAGSHSTGASEGWIDVEKGQEQTPGAGGPFVEFCIRRNGQTVDTSLIDYHGIRLLGSSTTEAAVQYRQLLSSANSSLVTVGTISFETGTQLRLGYTIDGSTLTIWQSTYGSASTFTAFSAVTLTSTYGDSSHSRWGFAGRGVNAQPDAMYWVDNLEIRTLEAIPTPSAFTRTVNYAGLGSVVVLLEWTPPTDPDGDQLQHEGSFTTDGAVWTSLFSLQPESVYTWNLGSSYGSFRARVRSHSTTKYLLSDSSYAESASFSIDPDWSVNTCAADAVWSNTTCPSTVTWTADSSSATAETWSSATVAELTWSGETCDPNLTWVGIGV